ncbi:radical SAM protein, partial [Patescibacteria group bacterium]|nr:radical SAM protein [Patescibacteria group bacterium]
MNELISLKSPLSVNWEVTPLCDLMCGFCFNASVDCRKLKHPPLSRALQILDALALAEVFEVRLFGGEFLIYPHWREVVEYADKKDFFLSFVSNGTHINCEVVKFFKQHRISGGAISLHGTREIYEKITQIPGSFNSAIDGIRACLDEGLGISILYTLTKENHLKVFETVEWLKNEGIEIDEINVGRLTPYGRAKSDWEEVKLSFKDYLNVFAQLKKIRQELKVLASLGDAFPMCLLSEEYQEYVVGCWQGTGFGHIDH